jgi:hypothetical protein
MAASSSDPQVLHRTARICLRTTPAQANRCYRLLRAAGDVWAWLLDSNRDRRQQGDPAVVGYRALCRRLTSRGGFGELSVVGPVRYFSGTQMPGSRPPAGTTVGSGPGSRAANASWSRSGSITAHS